MGVATELGTGYSGTAPTEKQLRMSRIGVPAGTGYRTLIYCHSALGSAVEPQSYSAGAMSGFHLLRQIVDSGYLMVAADLGGVQTWGNDTAVARVTEAITWAHAHGGKSGKVALVGSSMGGGLAQVYAKANPSSVCGLLLFAPVCDLNDFVTNNRAGQAASINAAYGGTYSDSTNGPTKSPIKFAASLASIPGQVWTSTADTVVISSTVDTVAAAWGSACDYHKASQGDHGSETEYAWILSNLATVRSFLAGLSWT